MHFTPVVQWTPWNSVELQLYYESGLYLLAAWSNSKSFWLDTISIHFTSANNELSWPSENTNLHCNNFNWLFQLINIYKYFQMNVFSPLQGFNFTHNKGNRFTLSA